jgi:hypothetical protein
MIPPEWAADGKIPDHAAQRNFRFGLRSFALDGRMSQTPRSRKRCGLRSGADPGGSAARCEIGGSGN